MCGFLGPHQITSGGRAGAGERQLGGAGAEGHSGGPTQGRCWAAQRSLPVGGPGMSSGTETGPRLPPSPALLCVIWWVFQGRLPGRVGLEPGAPPGMETRGLRDSALQPRLSPPCEAASLTPGRPWRPLRGVRQAGGRGAWASGPWGRGGSAGGATEGREGRRGAPCLLLGPCPPPPSGKVGPGPCGALGVFVEMLLSFKGLAPGPALSLPQAEQQGRGPSGLRAP